MEQKLQQQIDDLQPVEEQDNKVLKQDFFCADLCASYGYYYEDFEIIFGDRTKLVCLCEERQWESDE